MNLKLIRDLLHEKPSTNHMIKIEKRPKKIEISPSEGTSR